MLKRLGDSLYQDIESNSYLIELYNDILYNYSLMLFGNVKAERKEINISHALRFADLLSKSVHPKRAEKHKIWAQEIVALLNALYPKDETIKFYMGSVLTNAGNYQGLAQNTSIFAGTDLLDQSYNEYIRKSIRFAIILLQDILSSNDKSVVLNEFSSLLDDEKVLQIKTVFSSKPQTDDDINISVDQIENLTTEIAKGLKYPEYTNGKLDYNSMLQFLEELCGIFKWEIYEKSTLGYRTQQSQQLGKLRWYTVILLQWMSGNGLSLIINAAIKHKQTNPGSEVEIDGQLTEYNDSKEHKNAVISSTLNAIEDVILFRISNYFLRFSLEYKKYHNISELKNDWYEFVEYGTTNPLTILLQRNGFSREASTYIKSHQSDYIVVIEGNYKIKESLLSSQSKSVNREAAEIKYNIPELFTE